MWNLKLSRNLKVSTHPIIRSSFLVYITYSTALQKCLTYKISNQCGCILYGPSKYNVGREGGPGMKKSTIIESHYVCSHSLSSYLPEQILIIHFYILQKYNRIGFSQQVCMLQCFRTFL